VVSGRYSHVPPNRYRPSRPSRYIAPLTGGPARSALLKPRVCPTSAPATDNAPRSAIAIDKSTKRAAADQARSRPVRTPDRCGNTDRSVQGSGHLTIPRSTRAPVTTGLERVVPDVLVAMPPDPTAFHVTCAAARRGSLRAAVRIALASPLGARPTNPLENHFAPPRMYSITHAPAPTCRSVQLYHQTSKSRERIGPQSGRYLLPRPPSAAERPRGPASNGHEQAPMSIGHRRAHRQPSTAQASRHTNAPPKCCLKAHRR
jgi:hypothetical protein